jgi:hypothetical protein
MNARGHYGRADAAPRARGGATSIGLSLFHGTSDRDTAAEQINTQLMTIARAVVTAAGGDPSLVYPPGGFVEFTKTHPGQWGPRVIAARAAMEKSPLLPLWDNTVSPLWTEWLSFYGDRKHWYDAVTSFFTSWEDYLSWASRVNAVRDQVEAAGIKIGIPRLTGFSESVLDKVEKGVADVWAIAKYGVIAALAIGGVVVLSSVAQNLRTGKDPAEKYVELVRRRRRPNELALEDQVAASLRGVSRASRPLEET